MLKEEDVWSLSKNIANVYDIFYNIMQKRALFNNLNFPEGCLKPAQFALLSADEPDDFNKMTESMNILVEFMNANKLGSHSSKEQLMQQMGLEFVANSPQGDFFRRFVKTIDRVQIGCWIRGKVLDLLEFHDKKDEMLAPVYEERRIVDKIGKAISEEHFPVDGYKLARNFVNMAKIDPKKAYKNLITNPAAFAPIQTDDVKKGVTKGIKPDEGRKVNKELGRFLKGLKIEVGE